jgi:hypothetical protein
MKNFIFAVLATTFLSACNDPKPPVVAKPSIPKVSNWNNLSENEFQEIERRCLGVSHPTCDGLDKGRRDREDTKRVMDNLGKAIDATNRNADALYRR